MLKIGEFSRLSRLSVKTLRYYDEVGLLRPVEVDRWTGYRYYSGTQLPRLYRILALKDLGFSLEQIAEMMDKRLPAEQIRGMLRLRRAEIEQQRAADLERLRRVEARLRQIDMEGTMDKDSVVLKELEQVTVAYIRDTVPAYSDVGRLHGELDAFFRERGLHEVSPCMSFFHDAEYKESNADVEAAFPIAPGMVQETGRVKVREVPAVELAACLVHEGPYDGLSAAYDRLLSWVAANGYRPVGADREVYVHNMEHTSDPSKFVTELQIPVEKA